MNASKRKYFFGWNNIKWFITEIGNIGSDKPSYFSQKRIQQLAAFGILEWGAIYWLINKHAEMDTPDFAIWAGVQLPLIAYAIHHIQKEKTSPQTEDKTH